MDFNFAEALRGLPPNSAFRIMNEGRPPAAYLLDTLLPERPDYDYTIGSGSMTVRSTMAGLAAMDSPYPPAGLVSAATFTENTLKVASETTLGEAAIRRMQQMLRDLAINNQPTTQVIQTEALNFMDKVVRQAHLDTAEWMRGQALAYGVLQWSFNNVTVNVDYGVPSANKLATRTGNDAYGGSASKFWADIVTARRLLRNNVRAFILHPNTLDAIRFNAANDMVVIAETANSVTFRKKGTTVDGAVAFLSQDSADAVTLVSYGLEGEIYDTANPGQTLRVPMIPVGKIIAVGNNQGTRYVVGAGSTDPIENALGYTHIAPTVEGGGRPGRWGEMFTPEPWSFGGRGVTNLLPVIEAPEKIVILTTEVS